MTDSEMRPHPITSEGFARQLADLGVITADLATVERITITAQAGHILMIRVDHFGDGGDGRLAQAVADAQPQAIEQRSSELSAENHRLRELGREIVSMYAKTDSGYRARVGEVQIQRWLDQLGGS